MSQQSMPRIAVIGAGPVGLIAGRELLRQGFEDFTIFEEAARRPPRASSGSKAARSWSPIHCAASAP
jgi:2-polyprenyl-6-methoxyphenol hydroxylase-like FAD-dependent oxidoreductase